MPRLLVTLLVVAACRPTASRAPAPPPLVTVAIVPSSSHVVPGQPVELGVRFTMRPGWHIYWLNPGETGLATRVELVAPSWAPVEVQYPGPQSIRAANTVSYGYEGETALFLRATAPPEIAAPRVRLDVRARWLACREECIPGDAIASIELPVGDRAEASEDALASHRARLPIDPPADLASEWRDEPTARVLVLTVPGAGALELFPFAEQPTLFRGQEGAGERAEIRFQSPDAPVAPGAAVTGVLRVERDGATRYHFVSIPWH